MTLLYETPGEYAAKMAAARKGCCDCGATIPVPPAGRPFRSGEHCGAYRCMDCWKVYWASHPEDLADPESVEFCRKEASRIRSGRISVGAEDLFKMGDSKAVLTDRGTILFSIDRPAGLAESEFDPERFWMLVQAIRAVEKSGVPGFSTAQDGVL